MSKLELVLVFVLLFFENEASNQLCSVRKTENYCVCKRVTSEDQSSIITEADCRRIGLEDFPDLGQLTHDLNLLDLSYNKIVSLDQNASYSSKTLESLILSYNNISSISDSFLDKMPTLKTLILSHNNLKSLEGDNFFRSSRNITRLDLSFNNIVTMEIQVLLPLRHLQYLDLSYNDMTFGTWLSQTPDSLTAALGVNPEISTIKLDNLGLKDLHYLYFSNFTNLKHLSLADNRLEDVPTVPYTLEYLDISGSDITVLQVKHLNYHSLKTLKLERMKKLENIHHYAFYNLQALEELSIRNCHYLNEFNELIFGVLHKNMSFSLKRLFLSGNALESLNSTYKHLFKQLDLVDLSGNPWKCDCDLLWLQEFDSLVNIDNTRCSSPRKLKMKSLMDLTDKSMPTCYPQKYGKKSHRILITFLALLVIVLVALVAYLIYYTPRWYNNRSLGLGPQSPYNLARTNEG